MDKIVLKHNELYISSEQNTYIVITEIVNGIPVLTYCYKIPVEYQIHNEEFKTIELYYPNTTN